MSDHRHGMQVKENGQITLSSGSFKGVSPDPRVHAPPEVLLVCQLKRAGISMQSAYHHCGQ